MKFQGLRGTKFECLIGSAKDRVDISIWKYIQLTILGYKTRIIK